MDIILGSGNRRRVFTIATGAAMKDLAKENPVEHAKIGGNLKALVRQQEGVKMTPEQFARLRTKNEAAVRVRGEIVEALSRG